MRPKLAMHFFIVLLALAALACGATGGQVDVDDLAATVAVQVREELAATAAAATPEATATSEAVTVDTEMTSEAEVVVEATVQPEVIEQQAGQAADFQAALTAVYQQANPAVVYIIVPPFSSGTGFVFDGAGHIVTNNHVIEGGDTFEVVFSSGDRLAAEIVGSDVDSDLAVLKVDALPGGVTPLPLGDGEMLQVGQLVVAIGNPFGEEGSMSMGIISALGRSLPSQRLLESGSSYSLPEVIQTDAPINPGNSGGPLLNLLGEVVGVNSAIATATGTNSGVGYAIPVEAVKRIVPNLIERGSYDYPYMGAAFANELSLNDMETFGLSQTRGAYVLNVTPGSPAAQAGLIAADPNSGRGGDLVIALDDQPVSEFSDLNAYLVFHTSPGQTIQITVLRNGEEQVLPLTLASRP